MKYFNNWIDMKFEPVSDQPYISAGIMLGPRKETKDGFESQMGTNHLSHFLLTSKLLPLLKKAGTKERKARIVNVSSQAHHCGKFMDFDDSMGEWVVDL